MAVHEACILNHTENTRELNQSLETFNIPRVKHIYRKRMMTSMMPRNVIFVYFGNWLKSSNRVHQKYIMKLFIKTLIIIIPNPLQVHLLTIFTNFINRIKTIPLTMQHLRISKDFIQKSLLNVTTSPINYLVAL
jgi:hypothetical protein